MIRPGGKLRFCGHVRADHPGFASFQRSVDLAAGEIEIEECYERESALRHAEPPRRRGVAAISA